MTPTLSICIPTYNRLEYLKRSLGALAAQVGTCPRVEILVSDNASTDGTAEWLDTMAGWVRVIRQPRNIGPDANFGECVRLARGEHVWVFGDDEIPAPDCVPRLLDMLDRYDPSAVFMVWDGPDGAIRTAPSVPDLYRWVTRRKPSFALDHTLITAFSFRRSAFDTGRYRKALAGWTRPMAYQLGAMRGLRDALGHAIATNGMFTVREARAEMSRWPYPLCIRQALYLLEVSAAYGIPALHRTAIRTATRGLLPETVWYAVRRFPLIRGFLGSLRNNFAGK